MNFKIVLNKCICDAFDVAQGGGINDADEFFEYISEEMPKFVVISDADLDLLSELEFELKRLYEDVVSGNNDQLSAVDDFFLDEDVQLVLAELRHYA